MHTGRRIPRKHRNVIWPVRRRWIEIRAGVRVLHDQVIVHRTREGEGPRDTAATLLQLDQREQASALIDGKTSWKDEAISQTPIPED